RTLAPRTSRARRDSTSWRRQPAEERRGRRSAKELRNDEAGYVVRTNADEGVACRAREGDGRVRERRRRGEPVRRGDVRGDGKRDGRRSPSRAAPDDREKPERRHELAEHLSSARAGMTRREEQRQIGRRARRER